MRAVVQRVSRARVEVEGRMTGEIGEGLLVLVGVAKTDAEADAAQLAEKIDGLRLFNDDNGKMNVGDAVGILRHLFRGAGPFPTPFPGCGVDETPDALDCVSTCEGP